jgi:hypothetical protein
MRNEETSSIAGEGTNTVDLEEEKAVRKDKLEDTVQGGATGLMEIMVLESGKPLEQVYWIEDT